MLTMDYAGLEPILEEEYHPYTKKAFLFKETDAQTLANDEGNIFSVCVGWYLLVRLAD